MYYFLKYLYPRVIETELEHLKAHVREGREGTDGLKGRRIVRHAWEHIRVLLGECILTGGVVVLRFVIRC